MAEKFTGRCECGAITFEFGTAPDFVATCYCKDDQKSSGGVGATYFSVALDDFTLLTGTPRSYPYVADSGNTLQRNFCPDCGARLFNDHLSGFPGQMFVMIGSLDEPERIKPPIMEIFTARRLPWIVPLDVPQYYARPDADPSIVRTDLPGGCG